MASLFIGVNRGQEGLTPSDFTVGSSTGGTDIELRLDTGKSLTRLDVVKFLEVLSDMIADTGGPGVSNLFDFGATK